MSTQLDMMLTFCMLSAPEVRSAVVERVREKRSERVLKGKCKSHE